MEADKLDGSDTNELNRIRRSKAQRSAVSIKKIASDTASDSENNSMFCKYYLTNQCSK